LSKIKKKKEESNEEVILYGVKARKDKKKEIGRWIRKT
jgi:hypothetical protein